jgi:hypothetical protein
MTTANDWMKTSEVRRELRPARIGEWSGIGWADSSWELARGLEVVEDLPLDAWPLEFAHAVGATGIGATP